jgi:hypothetical protein
MIVDGHWNSRGGNAIDKIVIHHCAGVTSLESLYNTLAGKLASATYGIGSDGRIGQYVDEVYRPWTTGSYEIDKRAVTIETSNDEVDGDWHVSDNVLARLIDLVTDICQRNGITDCSYTGDTDGVLQKHCWWQNTNCPGPYLGSMFPYISAEVNKRLGTQPSPTPTPTPSVGHYEGETVSFSHCYTSSIGGTCYQADQMQRTSGVITNIIHGAAHPYLLDGGLCWVDDSCIDGGSAPAPSASGHGIGENVSFNKCYISSTSGNAIPVSMMLYGTGTITNIAENTPHPYLLNGGMCWVGDEDIIGGGSSPAADTGITAGDTVVVTNPVDWHGTSLGVSGEYTVMEKPEGSDRAVIGRGGTVTAAIDVHNLRKA